MALESGVPYILSQFLFENGYDLILRQVTTKYAFKEAFSDVNKLLMKED
jgi:hypothetical protein